MEGDSLFSLIFIYNLAWHSKCVTSWERAAFLNYNPTGRASLSVANRFNPILIQFLRADVCDSEHCLECCLLIFKELRNIGKTFNLCSHLIFSELQLSRWECYQHSEFDLCQLLTCPQSHADERSVAFSQAVLSIYVKSKTQRLGPILF